MNDRLPDGANAPEQDTRSLRAAARDAMARARAEGRDEDAGLMAGLMAEADKACAAANSVRGRLDSILMHAKRGLDAMPAPVPRTATAPASQPAPTPPPPPRRPGPA